MLNSFPLSVGVGTILGILSGLGTGGGSLLILWLTLVLNTDAETARLMNLLFFLPSAAIAIAFHWKKGSFHIKKVLPAIIAGSAAAALFAWLSQSWNTEILKKFFGILLIATAIRELRYKPKDS